MQAILRLLDHMGWQRVGRHPDTLEESILAQALPWLLSTAFHMVLFIVIALIPYHISSRGANDAAAFEGIDEQREMPEEITRFEVGDPPLEPTELTTETLQEFEAKPLAQLPQYNDDNPIFEERGGGLPSGVETGAGLGFDLKVPGLGPALQGGGGVDVGLGTGFMAGRGGAGSGFGLRGTGSREAIPGVTKASERAVAAALNWIARHQNRDGSWSLDLSNQSRCTDRTCTTQGLNADAAATAMAILPFLGAGQTHESNGPYQKHIARGLQWLVQQQKTDGDLSGGRHQMYSHGLGAIALCEAYGMTQDSRLKGPAQNALRFIETGQNERGGWRYTHGTVEGDTSVFGWQVMALKSGQIAGLQTDAAKFRHCRNWLDLVSSGYHGGKFGYLPGTGHKPSMDAVGLLALEYLGFSPKDRRVRETVETIMEDMPSLDEHDVYYWYYATLALHNIPGPEWDRWNRQIRRILIETQAKRGCAAGSWDPSRDAWGPNGGRLMVTSLSALTLEVYYRYMPLYQMDSMSEMESEPASTPDPDKPASGRRAAGEGAAGEGAPGKRAAERNGGGKPGAGGREEPGR